MIEQRFVEHIANLAGVQARQVAVAVQLFDKGASIPFVARYRKDLTGPIREDQLELIEERNVYFTALLNRRNAILHNLAERDKLDDDLRGRIMACIDMEELEDLYLAFRRQRRTRAAAARDQGLEPLAEAIWTQAPGAEDLAGRIAAMVGKSPGLRSPALVMEGVRAILVDRVVNDHAVRGLLREGLVKRGVLAVRATRAAEGVKTKFEAYYDFEEALSGIPSHRLLAVLRGEKLGYLQTELRVDDAGMLDALIQRFCREDGGVLAQEVRAAVDDAYWRALRPLLERETLAAARRRAEDEAIRVFRDNARNLLLSPAAGPIPVIGVEPDQSGGAVLAVVGADGAYIEHAVLGPIEAPEAEAATRATLDALIEKHGIRAVAVDNGEGARKAARFINAAVRGRSGDGVYSVYVNEAGAAIYSASKLAREELPGLDMNVRTAVTIARRLQDPLAELVKVEPRNIGVGQYQHDVNQRLLREGLYKTIVSCVNFVGVDLNRASVSLLRYVNGIQLGTAENIVAWREKHGPFTAKAQLNEIEGIGAKTFEQCAGFVRVSGGNPLDRTGIHPESYPIVRRMAASLDLGVDELVGNRDAVARLDVDGFAAEHAGPLTLHDIRNELNRPGRDPRKPFKAPRFIEGVQSIDDLQEGMEMDGVVTNVTNFGAFIDVGVQQDGLAHLSELANRFVRDPRMIVKVGEVVRVKVISVDREQPRISLSLKAAMPNPDRKARRRRPRREKPGARPESAVQANGAAEPPAEKGAPAASPPQRRSRPPRDAQRGERRPPARHRVPAESTEVRASEKGTPTKTKYRSGPEEGMNTQLAEQLEALRARLGK